MYDNLFNYIKLFFLVDYQIISFNDPIETTALINKVGMHQVPTHQAISTIEDRQERKLESYFPKYLLI